MPLAVLIVEGGLDVEILTAVFAGRPTVRPGGSKNSLKPQAKYERDRNDVFAGYLRDRDFDYEPPDNCDAAVIDSNYNHTTLGWRWARHEIENYLLDPAVVEKAIGIPNQEWAEAITDVARRIRWYQIARWTVGEVRRSLPPHYELETRPTELNELQLPHFIDEGASRAWCSNSIREFARRIEEYMSSEKVEASIGDRSTLWSVEHVSDATNALVCCSGKDLLAGLPDDTLQSAKVNNAGALRAVLRDWIRDNVEEAMGFFPEWRDLVAQMRS